MHFILLFCAKYLVMIVALVAAGYWLTLDKSHKLRLAVYGVITAVSAYALAKVGSKLFYDPRPFVSGHVTALYHHAADNGFPSDHTLLAAAVAIAIYSSSKRLGLSLMALAVIVGASRVIGHIHHAADIAGSIVFAIAGSLVAYYLTPRILKHLSTRSS